VFGFAAAGRALYAYVYPGAAGSTQTSLHLLDRLVVEVRR